MNFVHLHTHSDYSLIDGVTNCEKFLDRAQELGMSAMAITEHGNLCSQIYFYEEARKRKIKPLLGCEIYVADDITIKDRRHMSGQHLILIAKNKIGLKNLYALQEKAWTTGFYYKPKNNIHNLIEHRAGLICLTACLKGYVSVPIIQKDYDLAKKRIKTLKEIYGSDLYLELQMIDVISDGVNLQEVLNLKLIEYAERYGIELVVTSDVHYANEGGHKVQSKVAMINKESERYEEEMQKNLWLKTAKEILEARKKFCPNVSRDIVVKAIENTVEIANKCEGDLIETGGFISPIFDFKKHKEYNKEKTVEEFFENYVWALYEKWIQDRKINKDIYKERLRHEIKIMKAVEVINYILVVEDLINHAKSKGSLTQTRGSVNGSFICFLLGFSGIDPIKWNISFERFLSVARLETGKKDADIDIDFESEFRGRAVQYLIHRYGSRNVCSVGSFNRTQLKGAIKAIARVEEERYRKYVANGKVEYKEKLENFGFVTVNKVTKNLPGDYTIDYMYDDMDNRVSEWANENKKWLETYVAPIIGNVINPSVHPAGIVITPKPLIEYIPIKTQAYKGGRTVVTQWENGHMGREDLNLRGVSVIDILGVKTLSVVARTFKKIKKHYGKELALEGLDLNDKDVYERLANGENECIFQLNNSKLKEMLKNVGPDRFEDIVALNAINRPGPLSAQADKHYADRKNGYEKIKFPHESLRGVLGDTYGVPIYSEHLMGVVTEFARMSPVHAERLRKLVKAKDTATFHSFRESFIGSAVDAGREADVAKRVWDLVVGFGEYAFPKAHSAAYALVGYATMFLKHYYPAEFFSSYLDYADDEEYRVVMGVAKKNHGVKFVYPEINKSKNRFKVIYSEKPRVLWGFNSIKGIGEKACEAIIETQPYKDFKDFYKRVDRRKANKRIMEQLIRADVFRNFGDQQDIIETYYLMRKEKLPSEFKNLDHFKWQMVKYETLAIPGMNFEKLYKKKLSGMPIVKPLGTGQQEVAVVGQITRLYEHESKSGKMAFGALANKNETFSFICWPKAWRKLKPKPKKSDIIYMSGDYKTSREGMAVYIDQDNIFKKLS